MSSQKDAVVKQVASSIKKKWSQECTDILDKLFITPNKNQFSINSCLENTLSYNGAAISKINNRLEALEEINDRLYYTLCYLVENLPELISKTITSDEEICRKINMLNSISQDTPGKNILEEEKQYHPKPTRRENDILELLEKGFCAKEIASKLFISQTTVITHKKNLKKKFNVKNTVELISMIRNRKFI